MSPFKDYIAEDKEGRTVLWDFYHGGVLANVSEFRPARVKFSQGQFGRALNCNALLRVLWPFPYK